MQKRGKYTKQHSRSSMILCIVITVSILAAATVAGLYFLPGLNTGEAAPTAQTSTAVPTPETTAVPTTAPTEPSTESTTAPTEPEPVWESGFVAAADVQAPYYDENGTLLGTVTRGTQVAYAVFPDDALAIRVGERVAYLGNGAAIVSDATQVIPAHTLYVRTAVNLRDNESKLLPAFAEKGAAVEVTGCDYVNGDGSVHMYRVTLGEEEGYILPWYLAEDQTAALENYDNGSYGTHADRGNRYGGGDAASLDYFPREKGPIAGNDMPGECRTLYLVNWRLGSIDTYLDIARSSGINAFVVDIVDGGSVGYAGEVMKAYSPSAANAANNSVEAYRAAIQKIKDAGFYVIGRITTFNDSYFIKDHPEYAITDPDGNPLKLSGEYWPTAYNRTAWQYKVDLAVEAVELMGFNEIQFDYVRFPDRTYSHEENGTIDFHNTYGETKAQAIQRFLMYATDILHEKGAYVSADVYGESAYTYVTGYGQYWAAISNVVDAISGMPYPDHFSQNGDWKPWEHPYETLKNWGGNVMARQKETATPAVVRTWIQAYNAIREPYNTYGPDEVGAQIRGLRDSGCTGGFMTWNPTSDPEKYRSLITAFAPA